MEPIYPLPLLEFHFVLNEGDLIQRTHLCPLRTWGHRNTDGDGEEEGVLISPCQQRKVDLHCLVVYHSSMATIPKKVAERLVAGIKRYQPILAAAKARDVGETDTVTIIKDMLADVFGYDKYSELTSEYAIRGTFCDLAIKLDGKLSTLIEVKAIGIDLKEVT